MANFLKLYLFSQSTLLPSPTLKLFGLFFAKFEAMILNRMSECTFCCIIMLSKFFVCNRFDPFSDTALKCTPVLHKGKTLTCA